MNNTCHNSQSSAGNSSNVGANSGDCSSCSDAGSGGPLQWNNTHISHPSDNGSISNTHISNSNSNNNSNFNTHGNPHDGGSHLLQSQQEVLQHTHAVVSVAGNSNIRNMDPNGRNSIGNDIGISQSNNIKTLTVNTMAHDPINSSITQTSTISTFNANLPRFQHPNTSQVKNNASNHAFPILNNHTAQQSPQAVQGKQLIMQQQRQQQQQQQQQHPSGWNVSVPNPLQEHQQLQPQVSGAHAQVQPLIKQQYQQQHQQQQAPRTKIVLSQEARQALAKAIWSAIRSPTGDVDPIAMDEAVKAGLPQHAILNAARVARDREALKRKASQNPPPPPTTLSNTSNGTTATTSSSSFSAMISMPRSQHLKQQPLQPPPSNSMDRTLPSMNAAITSTSQDKVSQSAHSLVNPHGKPTAKQSLLPTTVMTQTSSVSRPINSVQQLKLEERNNWKRLHTGVFLVQKGRFLALTSSISCIVRAPTTSSPGNYSAILQQRTREFPLAVLKSIQDQEQLRFSLEPTETNLINPETMKRVKMEPKRVSKALERSMKKARQSTQEALFKKLKDLNKNLLAHSSDFFKYHKAIKSDASKLARALRDRLSKQQTFEKKKDESAERARLAALKANDMEAYKSLLEDTKNERLQYLWNKTDECLDQISTLLQKRNDFHGIETSDGTGSASKSSYYAAAHIREEEVRQPSILAGGELKEYQLAGLQWMISLYNNKLNGILADEMGLGKTIQAISLIAYLMEVKQNLGPYLVIVPLSTLSNWVNEFAKWCPTCRLIVFKGTPTQRRELFKNHVRNGQFNVLLTTYEYIIKDKGSLKKVVWQYAIVDEGHRMKNAQSKFAVTLGTVYTTNNRILLTGTPLQNNLPELWALLNFLLPAIFNSVESFDQWFNRPFSTFSNKDTEEQQDQILSNEERMLIIHRLHELLRPFMLRRVKSEVLDQLPEKVEKVLRCELSSWQKELYKQISRKATVDNKLDSFLDQQSATNNTRGLNNVVMQLRKVCNHPYLFSSQGYLLNDDMIRCSGKFHLLDDMLPKLKAAGHRVLMFTQMTALMTILEDYFRYRGYASLRLDGSTPADERERRMFKFNAPDSPYFIFLLSTRAGGLGLNLATADVVIIFDSDWNPMMDLQAQDRAHRIGQRSDVSVFRLITYSPVEEKILARANEKLNMSELVVEAGKFNQDSVENDNSLERKKMMEVLLTDFESNANKSQEKLDRSSEDGDEDDDEKDSTDSTLDINELLSNNEQDYQIYTEIDERRANTPCRMLYTDPNDIPDWIRYPSGSKEASEVAIFNPDAGRKRNAVAYDDGLTEKQFVRLMEVQAQNDEDNARKRKLGKILVKKESVESVGDSSTSEANRPPGTMTEWTFRKLINTCKAVIALKDPRTKRRLSEIFLEKPDPNVYPDYYTVIEKPIAINDILRKCRAHLYSSIAEFWDDWRILNANAKKFNGEGSWVANDADALHRELERVMKKNGLEEQPPPPKERKKLRIKLSLKALISEDTPLPPSKKKRKNDEG